jgi:hypothetical protein
MSVGSMRRTAGPTIEGIEPAREAPATSRSPIEENRRADEEDDCNG